MGNAAGAAHRIEEGACRHSPQDRRDPAMHLDRRDRVLVDQGDGHGLIPVHRTSSAFAETLSWPGTLQKLLQRAATGHNGAYATLTHDWKSGASPLSERVQNFLHG